MVTAMLLPYMHIPPAWDGGWYTACLLNATEAKFELKHFNCVGHTSFPYILILGISQYFDFGNIFLMQSANLLLWINACIFFYLILNKLSNNNRKTENALVTATLMVSPAITSNLLHLNLDFGVLVFFIPTLFFFINKQYFLAAAAGFVLCFTKELGLAMYVATAGLYILFFETSFLNLKLLKNNWIKIFSIGLPPLLYAAKLLRRTILYPDQSLFYTEVEYQFKEKPLFEMILDFDIFDPSFKSYLYDVFLLQFNWVLTGVAVVGLVIIIFNFKTHIKDKNLWFFLALLTTAIYITTRHRPFNHVRYLLINVPLLYIFCYIVINKYLPSFLKYFLYSGLTVLFILSNYRTIDPVSKYLFGTLPFGNHEVLNMGSKFYTGNAQRQTFNRDEQVYNLEYLKIHQLAEKFFADIRLNPYTVFVGSQDSRFFWPGLVDEKTLQRTGKRNGVFKPQYFDYVEEFSHMIEKPDILYYLHIPGMGITGQDVKLQQWYRFDSSKKYNIDGYTFKVDSYKKL